MKFRSGPVDYATKEEVLIEVLPYIQKYEGATFVIKYGGAAMTDPGLKATFAKDVTILRKIGINLVIVHGGGKDVTATADKLGIDSRFVDGQRYTDQKMLDVVLMVLAGSLNKNIVHEINLNGGHAIGLCGVDNHLFRARRQSGNGTDLGFVGEIVSVNIPFLRTLLQGGMMPVIAPLGPAEDGTLFNINADLAAASIAQALIAEKLVYLSDVEGVIADETTISTLTREEAEDLIDAGKIRGGMIPKVRSAFATVAAGVRKVHIVDGRVKHSLLLEIFTDEGIGTQLVPGPVSNRIEPEKHQRTR
jgi:acetylglutamate kinase